MRAVMQLVVVVMVEEFDVFVGRFEAESEGVCVVQKGGGVCSILSLRNQFLEFRFGHGGGGIFVDAEWGIYWVTSVTGGVRRASLRGI